MAKKSVPPDMMQELKLAYEGSVKRLWSPVEREERLWLEYMDEYSLFGWRHMPDKVRNRARSLSILSAFFFEQLGCPLAWKQVPVAPSLKTFRSDWLNARWSHLVYSHLFSKHGVPTHYLSLLAADGQEISFDQAANSLTPVFIEVLPATVDRPESYKLLGQKVFYYPPCGSGRKLRLIPLDVMFHFGLPYADPLKERLEADPAYLAALSIARAPEQGAWFDRPILEFFPRFEPERRRLSAQEALLIAAVTPGQFEEMIEMSYAIALFLFAFFAQRGIELWQGKLEFGVSREGLMLIDGLEPDDMTLLYRGMRLSKDFVEPFYRGGEWQAAIKEARKKAESLGRPDWQDICVSKLKVEPEPLASELKATLDQLYGSLTNHVVGRRLFSDTRLLDELEL